jgi:hypothetical protein
MSNSCPCPKKNKGVKEGFVGISCSIREIFNMIEEL